MENSFEIIRDARIPDAVWKLIAGAWAMESRVTFSFPLAFGSVMDPPSPGALGEIKNVTLLRTPGERDGRRRFFIEPYDEESAALLTQWAEAHAKILEDRALHGLRVQVETMARIAQARERQFTACRQDRDRIFKIIEPFVPVARIIEYYVEEALPDLTFPKPGTKTIGDGPPSATLNPNIFVDAANWWHDELARQSEEQRKRHA